MGIGTRKEAGWARPQTETESRPRRIQREKQSRQQSDRDGSGEGRPETRLRYRSLKRMVGWTRVGRLGEGLMGWEEDAQEGEGGQCLSLPPADPQASEITDPNSADLRFRNPISSAAH